MSLKTKIFTSSISFSSEFKRCTKEYDTLDMYVAWVGNPAGVLPYEYLNRLSDIRVLVGVAFAQTHPDGIKKLIDMGVALRVVDKKQLFHPKVYIFKKANQRAIFIGSSNFTYQGFFDNIESSVLLEGENSEGNFELLEVELQKLMEEQNSFIPDSIWLERYSKDYYSKRRKLRDIGVVDEVVEDENKVKQAAWLLHSDWEVYLRNVLEGLKRHKENYGEGLDGKLLLFERVNQELPLPWKVEYFESLEKRKLIGGMRPYGFLGHVAASGAFRSLLANGSSKSHGTIVKVINIISQTNVPIDLEILGKQLNKLVKLGPSMKVWSRVLALVRPDLFCTISSPGVRRSISNLLGLPEQAFATVGGYLQLLNIIHSSPWYNSVKPDNDEELEIWKRRVAFLDVVFFE